MNAIQEEVAKGRQITKKKPKKKKDTKDKTKQFNDGRRYGNVG